MLSLTKKFLLSLIFNLKYGSSFNLTIPFDFDKHIKILTHWFLNKPVNQEDLNMCFLFFKKEYNINLLSLAKEQVFEVLLSKEIYQIDYILYEKYNLSFFKDKIPSFIDNKVYPLTKHRLVSKKLFTFTVDSSKTKDIDDAISFLVIKNSQKKERYKVGVHISDVDFFIKRNCSIDKILSKKAKSIYTPNKVYSVFEKNFSNNLFSLKKGGYHPCLSFYFFFDESYNLCQQEILFEYIYIHENRNYEELENELRYVLKSKSFITFKRQKGSFQEIYILYLIAKKLAHSRNNFLLEKSFFKEYMIDYDAQKDLISIERIKKTAKSRFLIQELMVLTNFSAALFIFKNNISSIYYTQDYPEALLNKKADPFSLFEDYQKYKKKKMEVYPSYHFSLGLPLYTQVSSPIRRYIDLIVLRQIKSFLFETNSYYSKQELLQIIEDSGATIEKINFFERQVKKLWIYRFLKQEKNKTFKARIIKKSLKGYLIFLEDFFLYAYCYSTRKRNYGDIIYVQVNHISLLKDIAYFNIKNIS